MVNSNKKLCSYLHKPLSYIKDLRATFIFRASGRASWGSKLEEIISIAFMAQEISC